MQCAAQCHHKHDKFLGTYRDRKAVSHWGGNGLFNLTPSELRGYFLTTRLLSYRINFTALSQPAVALGAGVSTL